MRKKVSQAVIKRLPKYHTHLKELQAMGVKKISSKDLGKKMGLTASQVRQDFNCFGGFGQQGYGYPVDGLISSIASILNLDQKKSVVVIGVGNLGRAIIYNNLFKNGFELIAAFDSSPEVIGTEACGIHVYDVAGLGEFCLKNKPDIAVLTLPKQYAHDVAQLLCECGIGGICNFTNVDLRLQGYNIPVENVHFAENLMVLSYKLAEKRAEEQLNEEKEAEKKEEL